LPSRFSAAAYLPFGIADQFAEHTRSHLRHGVFLSIQGSVNTWSAIGCDRSDHQDNSRRSTVNHCHQRHGLGMDPTAKPPGSSHDGCWMRDRLAHTGGHLLITVGGPGTTVEFSYSAAASERDADVYPESPVEKLETERDQNCDGGRQPFNAQSLEAVVNLSPDYRCVCACASAEEAAARTAAASAGNCT